MEKLIKESTGEEHGLINVLANSNQDDPFKRFKGEDKSKAEKAYKEDHKVVKARYLNKREEPLDRVYCRWSGDPLQVWHCLHNEVYEVPLGLVNEINETKLEQRSQILDRDGVATVKDGSPIHIHQFVPVGF